jgi:hypothetical protein
MILADYDLHSVKIPHTAPTASSAKTLSAKMDDFLLFVASVPSCSTPLFWSLAVPAVFAFNPAR